MKVAIRVDASQSIGTGHVRRSLALAHALHEAGAAARFVIRDLGIDGQSMIEKEGFAAVCLAVPDGAMKPSAVPHAAWAEVDAARDAAETVTGLDGWQPDWMVIDHYGFDAEWHDTVRAALGCRIAVIDDLADRPLAADLVVDHNFTPDHRAKYEGRLAPEARLLGGPQYALLGPGFATAPRHEPGPKVGGIGIFMGGVDADNVSAAALHAVTRTGFAGPVEIVSTSANPNLAGLRRAASARAGTIVHLDLPDLAGFFARHDIQIGAGGGATWERCCIGAPTLLLAVAENQRAVVPALADRGIALSPEPLGTCDIDILAAMLRRLIEDAALRQDLSERARALVDGLGARRVALSMFAGSVAIRPARREDAGMMYGWRNDPATRRISRNDGEIAWSEHVAWLENVLANPDRSLMIGIVGNLPIGVIRFDRLDGGRTEVSLYLDPSLHGLSLGRGMLLAAERAAADGLDILAVVMERNASSARMFESAGYARVDATHWIKPAMGRSQARQAG